MFKGRALVTGGAGFVGSHLSRKLISLGFEPIVYDNLSVGRRDNVPDGASLVVADVLDETSLVKAARDVDVIFHLAAKVSVRASMDFFKEDAEVNIIGSINMAQAFSLSRAKKIIYASSMAVYANNSNSATAEDYHTEPISFYGISKLAAEKYILLAAQKCNKEAVVLRYFNIFGPGQALSPYVGVVTIFINRLLEGKSPLIFGTGEQVRDFVSVHDIVDGNIAALAYNGNCDIFNIGTGVGLSINNIADILIQKINPDIGSLKDDDRPGELRYSVADTRRAKLSLGFEAKRSFYDSVDEVIRQIASEKNRQV